MPRKVNTLEAWERRELNAQLAAMPTDVLICRDTRHRWHVVESFKEVSDSHHGKKNVYSRYLMCETCGMVRRDLYRHTRADGMVKLSSYYKQPDDYAFKNLSGVKGKANHARAEIYRREQNSIRLERTANDVA